MIPVSQIHKKRVKTPYTGELELPPPMLRLLRMQVQKETAAIDTDSLIREE
jgi:hypothetical protein